MISPELIRRYPFFGGLKFEHIVFLAQTAEEIRAAEGTYFSREGDQLTHFYLIVEGNVGIITELPGKREIVVSTLNSGDVFGWSALVPPYSSTAGIKSLTACRVLSFDSVALRKQFEGDCEFGFIMTQKIAQVIRERLKDLRIETLALIAG